MVIIEEGHSGLPASRTLRAMFEDRKSVFVDLLKWNVPILQERFELDQFDNEFATYVIVADGAGDHLGSARLLPTTRDHILDTLFPELCAGSPPKGPDILEITRFCLSRRQCARERLRTRNRLVSGLAAYALQRGIGMFTGVAEIAWLQQILAFGWDCRPLGMPIRIEHGTIAALSITITADTPDMLAANGIWETSEHPAPILKAA